MKQVCTASLLEATAVKRRRSLCDCHGLSDIATEASGIR
jgi:hypothetical protein